MTELSAPAGYSSSDLVFDDSFSGTTLDKYWNTYITSNAAGGYPWNANGSGGSAPGGPYDADYDMPSQVSVNNGLTLTAVQQSINGINQGGVSQTYPVTSGAVSSYGKFEFDGGYLQISMADTGGDGSWPALWLLAGQGAGSSGDNYEIDMQEGGMTNGSPVSGNEAWHLHSGAGTFGGVTATGEDLTSGSHTYGIDWNPGKSITWYVDGKDVGQITSAQTAIPSEPMEVVMSNQVANSNAAGWHTTLDSSTPHSMAMQISDVQLYQHAGSGDTVTGQNVIASSGTSSTGGTTTTGTGTGSTGTTTGTGTGSTGTTTGTGTGSTGTTTGTGTGSTGTTTGTGTGSTGSTTGTGTGTSSSGGTSSGSTSSTGTSTGTTGTGTGGVTDPTGTGSTSSGGTTTTGTGTGTSTGSTGTGTSSGSGSSGSVTPTAPTLTVASQPLSVSPGHSVDLGVSVSVPKAGDNVTVNVSGLPHYETITDKLDGKTFSGNSITLTAGEVNSGLSLASSFKGNGHPTATLTVTATDHTANTSSTAQSFVVKDPPASASVTGTSGSASSGSSVSSGSSSAGSSHGGSPSQWSNNVAQSFDQHPGFAQEAKTLSDRVSSISSATSASGAASTTASAGEKAFALLNQMMAGDFGNTSHFASAGSSLAQSQQQAPNLLTRPLH